MNIQVKLEISESERYLSLQPDDFGLTEDEWEALSNSERHGKVQEYVEELPEMPYWVIDRLTTES